MGNFPFHIYSETIALLSAIVFWSKIKDKPLRWFLPFLFLIVIAEICGWYFPWYKRISVAWMFNISIPLEYLFFSFLFFSYTKNKMLRFAIIIFALLFVLYVLYYSFFCDFEYVNYRYLLIGSFCMVIFGVAYFIERYWEISTENLWDHSLFWVATGVILFNVGEFSYNMVSSYIIKNKFDPVNQLFRDINNKLIILFYLLITVAIIKCRKSSKV